MKSEQVTVSKERVEMQEQMGLKRGLKSRHLQLLALGGIIGSGYFLGSGYIIGEAGPGAALAYLLGGFIIFMVMFSLGELAVAMPVSGSFVTYAKDLISPTWACGVGWSYWSTWVTYVPSEMIAGGIIMNYFFPQVDKLVWAILFGVLLTLINLAYVGTFGEMEFWMAIVKISAIVMFTGFSVLIFFGVIGNHEGVIGTSVLLGNGGFFPEGISVIFLTMVIIMVNFQGSELIGLAAGESQQPEKSIPKAIRNVTFRIIAMYVIPLFLLVLIFPWDQAGLEESAFAAALSSYGFGWAGAVFSIVVLTAAMSCANSGIYGSARALYGLAQAGMAPKFLGKLNKSGVPQNGVLMTIIPSWIALAAYSMDESESIYTVLLALSGFTGIMSWISISWSQLNFRRRLQKLDYNVANLKFRIPLFPYLTHLAIWSQVAIMVYMAFNPDLRISLYIGLPMLIVPMLLYKLSGREKESIPGNVNIYDKFLNDNGVTKK